MALTFLVDPDHLREAEGLVVVVGHLDRLEDVGCVYSLQALFDIVVGAVVGQGPLFFEGIFIGFIVRNFKCCIFNCRLAVNGFAVVCDDGNRSV